MEVRDAPGYGVMSHRPRETIKLSTWAKREGINLRTAQRMHQRGELPVPAFVTDTGRILVFVEVEPKQSQQSEEVTEELRSLREQVARLERKLDKALARS